MIMRTELAALRFNPCTRIVFYRTLTISGVSHILAGMASGRDIPAAAVSPAGRRKFHIPPDYVVRCVATHRKPPEVRIWRLSIQSDVGTRPPSTSTPHCPAWMARHW
jgi:hypothetical protein